ncbi:MAG TPA: hypothetical protein VK518_05755 [Puia sp.]|nr:hypothetical protein [Puia sp.]
MKLSPVLLFTYKRLDQTRYSVEALQRNHLADQSELYIFSDGPRTKADAEKVQSVREYLKTIGGFKKTTLKMADKNQGLANSIIGGVTELINIYGKVIVLEDDLVTSSNFLSFCNQALSHYKADPQVFSVSGYTRPISGLKDNGVYFTSRASSWGWATWKEKWNEVDWKVNDYASFSADRKARRAFNRMGSDMAGMLDRQMRGEIDSWAIRWCYHQFRKNYVTVFPATSKVRNIGFNEHGSHTTGRFNSFRTDLDESDSQSFEFSRDFSLDKGIIREFTRPYWLSERIKNKVLNKIFS